ncbi:MAG: stage II sporulation protein SpoIID, partial [Fibrobacteraceae bacterium]
ITILDRLPGGRVKTLLVETNKGTIKVKNDRTRWLFKRGTKILPSSNFEISKERDHWVIKGRGFGHGVGMCQMGVRARARAGQTYQEILSHYYPGTSLERLVP